ncbi:unknown [Bifidobacterium longum CAG:69]|nr:unknown [Bifidobacterium longum CAG:69]
MFTWPTVGVIEPSINFSNVDLPAPFAPTMPKRSPGPISQVTSSRISRPETVTLRAAEVTPAAAVSSSESVAAVPPPMVSPPVFMRRTSRSSASCGLPLSASAFLRASSADSTASGTPASTRRGSVMSVTATSTEPCSCGSAYMALTTSTREADAESAATSGSISAMPCGFSKICVTSTKSTTCLPRREVAICFSSSVLRIGGTSAINSRAALTWNFCLVERARAPRESHASSLRARLRRLVSRTSAWRSRSTRCSIYAE